MVQFNLLPDVKIEFIKTRRTKRFIMLMATISAAAALTLLVTLFSFVNGYQKKRISDLNKDIKQYDAQLQKTPEIKKILTIQNQLNSLTALHDQKPVASRLFNYIGQITPAAASITSLSLDYAGNTLSISGEADSLSIVNKFADTIKFTTFTTTEVTNPTVAFSNVVLESFGRTEDKANYVLNANFDPVIFGGLSDVVLSVPNIISTRSETEKPAALFGQ